MLDSDCTNACAFNGLPGPMRHWFTGFTHSLTGRPAMHWAGTFEQFSRIKHWHDWKDVAANEEQWMVEVDDSVRFCTA